MISALTFSAFSYLFSMSLGDFPAQLFVLSSIYSLEVLTVTFLPAGIFLAFRKALRIESGL